MKKGKVALPTSSVGRKASPKGGGLEGATASFLLAFGCILATISLFMPPEGEIDGSVLMLFGQILVYSGSIFGVKIYIKDLIKRANK
jgi:hypothetical protein